MSSDDSRLFIAELYPRLGAHLARQHEGGYDAAAGRTRFVLWLAAHTDGADELRDYLARAAQAPRLAADEEAALAARARAGGPDGVQAGERLVEASLHLVVATARRYAGRGVPFADLVQAGHAGLTRAVGNYDPARGYRFGTYATWWIRQAITRTLAGRPPGQLPDAADRLTRAERELLQVLGRQPSPEELAAYLS
jgi:RNA polymerase primary sigma factor